MVYASNGHIVEALRRRDGWIIEVIRDENLDSIRWLMYDFGIFHYSVEDMFTDVVVNLYRSVDRPGFFLNCDIHKYVMKIAREQIRYFKYRTWNEKKLETTGLKEAEHLGERPLYEEMFDMERLFDIVTRHISKLAQACKQIMTFILKGFSHKEIAQKMKMPQDDVRKKKWKCRENLLSSMNDDPEYCKIMSEDDQFKMETP